VDTSGDRKLEMWARKFRAGVRERRLVRQPDATDRKYERDNSAVLDGDLDDLLRHNLQDNILTLPKPHKGATNGSSKGLRPGNLRAILACCNNGYPFYAKVVIVPEYLFDRGTV
jgi:hypothetical protein